MGCSSPLVAAARWGGGVMGCSLAVAAPWRLLFYHLVGGRGRVGSTSRWL